MVSVSLVRASAAAGFAVVPVFRMGDTAVFVRVGLPRRRAAACVRQRCVGSPPPALPLAPCMYNLSTLGMWRYIQHLPKSAAKVWLMAGNVSVLTAVRTACCSSCQVRDDGRRAFARLCPGQGLP